MAAVATVVRNKCREEEELRCMLREDIQTRWVESGILNSTLVPNH